MAGASRWLRDVVDGVAADIQPQRRNYATRPSLTHAPPPTWGRSTVRRCLHHRNKNRVDIFLSRARVDGAEPGHRLTPQGGLCQESGASAVGLRDGSVGCGISVNVPEGHDGELRVAHDLPLPILFDPALRMLGQPNPVGHRLRECVDPEHLDRCPELQPDDTPRELDAAVALVGLVGYAIDGAEVLGPGGIRALKFDAVATEQDSAFLWLEPPLVRVEADRISSPDARQQRSNLKIEDGCQTVRAIHVQPGVKARSEFGYTVEGIDCAGIRCAGIGDDRDGWHAFRSVFGQSSLQSADIDSKSRVRRQAPLLRLAQPQNVACLPDRRMSLIGAVHDATPPIGRAIPRHPQRSAVGRRPSRHEDPLGCRRQTENLTQPAQGL